MFAAINAPHEDTDADEAARETVEAKAARLTASYRDALQRLQCGDRESAESAPPISAAPSRLARSV
jgi:hypothetical protein